MATDWREHAYLLPLIADALKECQSHPVLVYPSAPIIVIQRIGDDVKILPVGWQYATVSTTDGKTRMESKTWLPSITRGGQEILLPEVADPEYFPRLWAGLKSFGIRTPEN